MKNVEIKLKHQSAKELLTYFGCPVQSRSGSDFWQNERGSSKLDLQMTMASRASTHKPRHKVM